MLSRVEKIAVIDTLDVDRNAFFRHYRLFPSAGTILTGEEVRDLVSKTGMPEEFDGTPQIGFTNEFEDYLVWSQPDTAGILRLAESVRLIDGTWSTPRLSPMTLNLGREAADIQEMPEDAVDASFPFMADDGQTLYFAADNDMSLGGYDIFMATKDPSDGTFLIPRNMGMPFNSEYDDYMLVLDRQSGVGWWASDRNRLEDKITIYLYIIDEDPEYVDPSDPELEAYATLSGWMELSDPDRLEEIERFKKELASIKQQRNLTAPDFNLPMPGGSSYHYFSDFRNTRSVTLMKRYLGDRKAFEDKLELLSRLRTQYHKNRKDKSLGERILLLENELRDERARLNESLSEIYRLETD